MGEVAARLADRVIVTDDNPARRIPRRSAGHPSRHERLRQCREIGDRLGDRPALAMLGPNDGLLIAGKGHETGQIVGGRTLPFPTLARRALLKDLPHEPRHRERLPVDESGLVGPLAARVSGSVPRGGATGISIDTRTLQKATFFAIKGPSSDGHDYVGAAFEKGAVAAVVDEAHAEALRPLGPLYIVSMFSRAERLGAARAPRRPSSRDRFGGKTSTKEVAALAAQAGLPTRRLLRTTIIGACRSPWRECRNIQASDHEIGMNHPAKSASFRDGASACRDHNDNSPGSSRIFQSLMTSPTPRRRFFRPVRRRCNPQSRHRRI
jgi:hypothetical protein